MAAIKVFSRPKYAAEAATALSALRTQPPVGLGSPRPGVACGTLDGHPGVAHSSHSETPAA